MTELTAEQALERLVVHTAMEDAAVASECEAVIKPLLARDQGRGGGAEIIHELQHIRVGMLDNYQAATVLERLVEKARTVGISSPTVSAVPGETGFERVAEASVQHPATIAHFAKDNRNGR